MALFVPWEEIESSEEYQNLDEEGKAERKREYYETFIKPIRQINPGLASTLFARIFYGDREMMKEAVKSGLVGNVEKSISEGDLSGAVSYLKSLGLSDDDISEALGSRTRTDISPQPFYSPLGYSNIPINLAKGLIKLTGKDVAETPIYSEDLGEGTAKLVNQLLSLATDPSSYLFLGGIQEAALKSPTLAQTILTGAKQIAPFSLAESTTRRIAETGRLPLNLEDIQRIALETGQVVAMGGLLGLTSLGLSRLSKYLRLGPLAGGATKLAGEAAVLGSLPALTELRPPKPEEIGYGLGAALIGRLDPLGRLRAVREARAKKFFSPPEFEGFKKPGIPIVLPHVKPSAEPPPPSPESFLPSRLKPFPGETVRPVVTPTPDYLTVKPGDTVRTVRGKILEVLGEGPSGKTFIVRSLDGKVFSVGKRVIEGVVHDYLADEPLVKKKDRGVGDYLSGRPILEREPIRDQDDYLASFWTGNLEKDIRKINKELERIGKYGFVKPPPKPGEKEIKPHIPYNKEKLRENIKRIVLRPENNELRIRNISGHTLLPSVQNELRVGSRDYQQLADQYNQRRRMRFPDGRIKLPELSDFIEAERASPFLKDVSEVSRREPREFDLAQDVIPILMVDYMARREAASGFGRVFPFTLDFVRDFLTDLRDSGVRDIGLKYISGKINNIYRFRARTGRSFHTNFIRRGNVFADEQPYRGFEDSVLLERLRNFVLNGSANLIKFLTKKFPIAEGERLSSWFVRVREYYPLIDEILLMYRKALGESPITWSGSWDPATHIYSTFSIPVINPDTTHEIFPFPHSRYIGVNDEVIDNLSDLDLLRSVFRAFTTEQNVISDVPTGISDRSFIYDKELSYQIWAMYTLLRADNIISDMHLSSGEETSPGGRTRMGRNFLNWLRRLGTSRFEVHGIPYNIREFIDEVNNHLEYPDWFFREDSTTDGNLHYIATLYEYYNQDPGRSMFSNLERRFILTGIYHFFNLFSGRFGFPRSGETLDRYLLRAISAEDAFRSATSGETSLVSPENKARSLARRILKNLGPLYPEHMQSSRFTEDSLASDFLRFLASEAYTSEWISESFRISELLSLGGGLTPTREGGESEQPLTRGDFQGVWAYYTTHKDGANHLRYKFGNVFELMPPPAFLKRFNLDLEMFKRAFFKETRKAMRSRIKAEIEEARNYYAKMLGKRISQLNDLLNQGLGDSPMARMISQEINRFMSYSDELNAYWSRIIFNERNALADYIRSERRAQKLLPGQRPVLRPDFAMDAVLSVWDTATEEYLEQVYNMLRSRDEMYDLSKIPDETLGFEALLELIRQNKQPTLDKVRNFVEKNPDVDIYYHDVRRSKGLRTFIGHLREFVDSSFFDNQLSPFLLNVKIELDKIPSKTTTAYFDDETMSIVLNADLDLDYYPLIMAIILSHEAIHANRAIETFRPMKYPISSRLDYPDKPIELSAARFEKYISGGLPVPFIRAMIESVAERMLPLIDPTNRQPGLDWIIASPFFRSNEALGRVGFLQEKEGGTTFRELYKTLKFYDRYINWFKNDENTPDSLLRRLQVLIDTKADRRRRMGLPPKSTPVVGRVPYKEWKKIPDIFPNEPGKNEASKVLLALEMQYVPNYLQPAYMSIRIKGMKEGRLPPDESYLAKQIFEVGVMKRFVEVWGNSIGLLPEMGSQDKMISDSVKAILQKELELYKYWREKCK